MNSNLFKDLWTKAFKSGNPVYFYIGVNMILFVLVALFGSYGRMLHLLFNMLWLYWMGQIFMSFLKARQFHFVYLSGAVTGAFMFSAAAYFYPSPSTGLVQVVVASSFAAVASLVIATATLVPDYSIRLLLFGDVKLKYLALAYIVLDLISMSSSHWGASLASLCGALFGFSYIKLIRSGIDWSTLFKKTPRMKVVRSESAKDRKVSSALPNQQEVDAILDKISKSGYDQLSRAEKETLFKASKD